MLVPHTSPVPQHRLNPDIESKLGGEESGKKSLYIQRRADRIKKLTFFVIMKLDPIQILPARAKSRPTYLSSIMAVGRNVVAQRDVKGKGVGRNGPAWKDSRRVK